MSPKVKLVLRWASLLAYLALIGLVVPIISWLGLVERFGENNDDGFYDVLVLLAIICFPPSLYLSFYPFIVIVSFRMYRVAVFGASPGDMGICWPILVVLWFIAPFSRQYRVHGFKSAALVGVIWLWLSVDFILVYTAVVYDSYWDWISVPYGIVLLILYVQLFFQFLNLVRCSMPSLLTRIFLCWPAAVMFSSIFMSHLFVVILPIVAIVPYGSVAFLIPIIIAFLGLFETMYTPKQIEDWDVITVDKSQRRKSRSSKRGSAPAPLSPKREENMYQQEHCLLYEQEARGHKIFNSMSDMAPTAPTSPEREEGATVPFYPTLTRLKVDKKAKFTRRNAAAANLLHEDGGHGIQRSVRIVQITDPHLGTMMSIDRLTTICEQTVTLNPDIVLLTGDFFTVEAYSGKENTLARALAPLALISGKTFACLGNHDKEHCAEELAREGLEKVGVRLLVGDEAIVNTSAGRVQILGMDYSLPVGGKRQEHIEAVLRQYPRRDDCVLRLIQLHDPGAVTAIPPEESALVLSGHTHGGQVGLLRFGINLTMLTLTTVPANGLWGWGRSLLYVHRGHGCRSALGTLVTRAGVPTEHCVLNVLV